MERKYLCIDLKSFYASVECIERGLDPLTTNLVVADNSRTEKTICLAVTPSLKAYGISGRARLFEVVQKVKEINIERKRRLSGRNFEAESYNDKELKTDSSLAVSYIIAPPRMEYYSNYSAKIFGIYLKYVAKEDIISYSIDEVFMDITQYLSASGKTPHQFAMSIIRDVLAETGITATAGIGTNLYLAKIAMDVMAKKMPADEYGVRIAELDEMTYRRELWGHQPLTDFWRIGKGTAKRLESNRMYTMGDVAKASLTISGEKRLFSLFGKNAELIIDHAWGIEPVTIDDIKKYVPEKRSIGSGQVLHCPYNFDSTRIIVKEMLELLALDLVEKKLVTNQIVLTIGYDIENLTNPEISRKYNGEVTTDFYGRKVPKHAHGTVNLSRFTSSARLIINDTLRLFDEIVNVNLLVRRVNISANNITAESDAEERPKFEQLELFVDYEKKDVEDRLEQEKYDKERKLQEATIEIKKRFGKNAILKGMNLQDGATTRERNEQIGGHKK